MGSEGSLWNVELRDFSSPVVKNNLDSIQICWAEIVGSVFFCISIYYSI